MAIHAIAPHVVLNARDRIAKTRQVACASPEYHYSAAQYSSGRSLIMATQSSVPAATVNRWVQLVAGIVCMVMIANLQYGWTYFVDPIDAKYHWGRASIQGAFTIFVATETWLVPIEGWFVDKFGPRIVVMFGGVVVALAWWLNSIADSLPKLYVAAAIAGVGAGAVYG